MLNRSTSLVMSTSVLKALPGKLDIKRHSPSILHLRFIYLGDNCIQNICLGRYIVGYTVGNLVLRGHVSGAVKRDF